MDFLTSDTFRRVVAALVGVCLPAINAWIGSKLGVTIPPEATVSGIVLMAGYIGQSVANAIHLRATAAKTIATVDDAAKVINTPAAP